MNKKSYRIKKLIPVAVSEVLYHLISSLIYRNSNSIIITTGDNVLSNNQGAEASSP